MPAAPSAFLAVITCLILVLAEGGYAASSSTFKVTHNFQSNTGVGVVNLVCNSKPYAQQTCYGTTYMGE